MVGLKHAIVRVTRADPRGATFEGPEELKRQTNEMAGRDCGENRNALQLPDLSCNRVFEGVLTKQPKVLNTLGWFDECGWELFPDTYRSAKDKIRCGPTDVETDQYVRLNNNNNT